MRSRGYRLGHTSSDDTRSGERFSTDKVKRGKAILQMRYVRPTPPEPTKPRRTK